MGHGTVGERKPRRTVTKKKKPAESAAESEAPAGPDLVALAEGLATSRRDLVAFSEQVGRDPDPDAVLRRALDRRSDRAFTHLLFARLHLGHPVDAAVLSEGAGLLPDGLALAAAAGRVAGDVGEALIRAVRGRRLGWDREPVALLVAELWSRRSAVPRPEGLLAEARIRARRQLTHEGEDALTALQALIDDPDLAALIEPFDAADVRESARSFTSRLVDTLLGAPLDVFPERPQRASRSRAPVRRAVAKVGRNDACPCGSGKKYKVCHEAIDRERLSESSDVEGLTFGELAKDLERHLTPERIASLRGHELARLDPTRIPVDLRADHVDHLAAWGELDAAALAVEAWIPPGGELDDALDDVLRLAAEHAARAGRADLVGRLVARRGGRTDDLLLEARLVSAATAEERLSLLEEAARAELDTTGVDLGFALIACGLPALGIHVARSELALRGRDENTDALYATVVEARDQLLVPPWDPIDDVLYTLDHGVAPEVDRELADTRQKMDRSDAALRATKEALESLKEELERRESQGVAPAPTALAPVPAAVSAADDRAVRELRERLEVLKADLKERHNERNALRRELDQSRAQIAELESAQAEEPEVEEEEDDEDDEALDVTVAAKVRVPVFPDDFHQKLREVPEATARAAMMRIGEVCAGVGVAFREVRPLRGFDGVWRVKVGRSYRLLFRPLDHTLEVVELLHRQDLEKRLFRLRRGGEG